jgi:hypothetical protein
MFAVSVSEMEWIAEAMVSNDEDIASLVPNVVAAETFATVHPSNNRKLTKDVQKLARECPEVQARYVFFGEPGFRHEPGQAGN